MPLPSELVYNSLDGDEIKRILCARFLDVLNQVSDFRAFVTFPRVRMELAIRLEVAGRTPPNFRVLDDVVVRLNPAISNIPKPGQVEKTFNFTGGATINGDDLEGGQPPDEIREEHSLPIPTPQRSSAGFVEDTPKLSRREGKYNYAAFVEQDYGPARTRTGGEGPVIGMVKNSDRAAPTVNFREVLHSTKQVEGED